MVCIDENNDSLTYIEVGFVQGVPQISL